MRIGIDIDDVITDTSIALKKYISNCDTNEEISNYMEEIMRGEMPTPSIKKFLCENFIEIWKTASLKENSREVMKKLIDIGNEIVIITSRGEMKFKGSEKFTLEYLKANGIKYTEIIFDCFDKAKVCKENKIDVMVDDSVKYCTEIAKENIKSIVFTSDVNKSIDTEIDRVDNWLDLENKINNMCL